MSNPIRQDLRTQKEYEEDLKHQRALEIAEASRPRRYEEKPSSNELLSFVAGFLLGEWL